MDPNTSMNWRDRFKWLNAFFFIVCGVVIVYRTYRTPAAWLALLTGVAFLVFGIYRIRLIQRALKGELPPPKPGRRIMRPRL